jgi:hypothetical protein
MVEHAFGILGAMKNMDEQFEGLRRSAACAQLNREQISNWSPSPRTFSRSAGAFARSFTVCLRASRRYACW